MARSGRRAAAHRDKVRSYDVAGFIATLDTEAADAEAVIALYRDHGTHEQFQSEIKTDFERLPSRKFATNV